MSIVSMSEISPSNAKYWLLKAEPDSRVVKGKDVKFSVDDFESVQTSPWEGVRNYEARNLMKLMKVGDKALFYHSNCKNPGIAAFAQVAKEAYPDYTAWDPSHPYYDPKSNSENPRWFMVNLTFSSRAKIFIPLSLLRYLADASAADLPKEMEYIGEEGIRAIKTMDLVSRGRLSVQRVNEDAWNVIVLLSEKGGWEEMDLKSKKRPTATTKGKAKRIKIESEEGEVLSDSQTRKRKKNVKQMEGDESGDVDTLEAESGVDGDESSRTKKRRTSSNTVTKRKRKVKDVHYQEDSRTTRSSRARK